MSRLQRISNLVAAINKMEFVGDWDPKKKKKHGYLPQDVRLLTNPKAVEKIHKKWSATDHSFDFYFVKQAGASKHIELGEVTPEFVKENLKLDIQPSPDSITVVFTNNKGDEKVPMTAWIMAHRFGHSLRNRSGWNAVSDSVIFKDLARLLEEGYGIARTPRMYSYDDEDRRKIANKERLTLSLCHAIGTMKSARDGNLRNSNEFGYELLAQYIFSGKVKFNPLPRYLETPGSWGRKNRTGTRDEISFDQAQLYLKDMARRYPEMFRGILSSVLGKIFVM